MKKAYLCLRIIFLCYINVLVSPDIYAQQYEWTLDEFVGSMFLDIFEVNGEYYAAVSNGAMLSYDPNVEYKLSIYKIQFESASKPDFTLNEVFSLPSPENYSTNVIHYIQEKSLWIMVQHSVVSLGKQRYKVILCNENFDVIAESSIDTLGNPINFHIDSYNGYTYILGTILGPPGDQLFYLKYSHDSLNILPSINITQSEPMTMTWITSMNVDNKTGNMLVFYYNGIAVLDSNLYQLKRFNSIEVATSDHGYLIDIGENYYSHGARDSSWDVGIRKMVLHKYDTNFAILKADTFGWPGQDNYPFFAKSIDHNNGRILVGGHFDGPFNSPNTFGNLKKYYLAQYDLDLNQLWYKEYGGDKAYWLAGVHLLEDGDCFAYGFITDVEDSRRYAYIMHVDKNGEILSSQTIPYPKTSIKVVNPGDEILRIHNPENLNVRIALYDMQGHEIIRREILSELTEFNVAGLPAGIYPYIFTKDKIVIGSGKWIKAQ